MGIDARLDVTEYINGKKVDYIDETHAYYVDGVKVPSVTQIVAAILPSPYKDVEPTVLQQAANRGVALHKEIELFEQQGVYGSSIEFNNYMYLKKFHHIEAIENEKLVIIHHEGKVVCAGRLDMIIKMDGQKGLGIGDVKRTSEIHFNHLKLQLNLYRLGYMQSYGKSIDHLTCLHLRRFVHEIISVPIDEAYANEAIKKYIDMHL